MIAKMKSNISIGETIGYNLKHHSQLIDTHNLVGDQIRDYELQMRKTQELFEGRAKNLTAHIILSPSIEDGINLTTEEWKGIANDYLKKANLERYESIAFLHRDKEHTHLHIVANRIDDEGKIYRNGNELKLSQRIGNEIAKERGLKQAREVMLQNQHLREQGIEPKSVGAIQELRNDLRVVAEMVTREHKGFDREKYLQRIEHAGHKVIHHLEKETGKVKGYSVEKDGCFYPASTIGKEYTLKNLEKEYGQQQESSIHKAKGKEQTQTPLMPGEETIKVKRYDYKNDKEMVVDVPTRIQEDFKKALDSVEYENPLQLRKAMEEKGITVSMNVDKGRYSLTKDGHTLNASEIGKGYTLGNLEKLRTTAAEKTMMAEIENPSNNQVVNKKQSSQKEQEKIYKGDNEQLKELHRLLDERKRFERAEANKEINRLSAIVEAGNVKKSSSELHRISKALLEQMIHNQKITDSKEMIRVVRYKFKRKTLEEIPKAVQTNMKNAIESIKYDTPEKLKRDLEKKGFKMTMMDTGRGSYRLYKAGYSLYDLEIGNVKISDLERTKEMTKEKDEVKSNSIYNLKDSFQEKMSTEKNLRLRELHQRLDESKKRQRAYENKEIEKMKAIVEEGDKNNSKGMLYRLSKENLDRMIDQQKRTDNKEMIRVVRYQNKKMVIHEVPKHVQEDMKKAIHSIQYDTPEKLKQHLEKQGFKMTIDPKGESYKLYKNGELLNDVEIGNVTIKDLESAKKSKEQERASEIKNEQSKDQQQQL